MLLGRSHTLVTIIIVALFTACSGVEKDVKLSISESEMVDIMFDLRVIENQINKHHVLDRDSVSNLYRKMLLEIHDIDSVSLSQNLKVLQGNPRLAKSIEDGVLKRIATLQEDKEDEYK